MRPGVGGGGVEQPSAADIALAPADREALLAMVAQVAPTNTAARRLLRQLHFPTNLNPAWASDMTAEDWWDQVFIQFELGAMPLAFQQLILCLIRTYQANAPLRDLHNRYVVQPQDSPTAVDAATPQPAAAAPEHPGCHVIVRANTEEERDRATEALRAQRLEPHEVWSTEHGISFVVCSSDPTVVRRRLAATDLGWTVVAPGEPDYVIRTLYVQGPDGSRFRLVDTPAQQTFREVAEEINAEYEAADVVTSTRPAVIDHIASDGSRRRMNPNHTLHEANVQEGDHLGVGLESRAGAVNPIDHENALHRVQHQILEFARGCPGMIVQATTTILPSEYEIALDQPGFAPPRVPGGAPVEIDHHRLLIELGPDFPETAPLVFWLTPIFHPNVFPNYDCDAAREQPHLRGLVCLGELSDAWYPAMDFGYVCQMLVDMAGYRNYDLHEVLVNVEDRLQARGNFFDRAAAEWAAANQSEIVRRGGTVIRRLSEVRPKRRRNVIHPLD